MCEFVEAVATVNSFQRREIYLQLQDAQAEPVAECKSKPGLNDYYYVVDSVDRCIFYPCKAYINQFEHRVKGCPQGLSTELDYPTNNYPCTIPDPACPRGK